ncbi:hypothetical protein IA57_04425 [Mangrovimonas yunxiaonensis]|uniref:Lipocalin-like domain-containing protein n=1 Tax=Mangrovimonas yunxiaonensis TaxID=1197477 RepID=A0A084TK51_9FLAO|nr:lipocalin family protein [Mangrovimonas yunxiaonensis]KFB01087.1 hypothetical protein IA57_04425 [Mangrovimonas yunxiaonensis]GGH38758.1 hypothetical protein GCM10011364_07750 [Mangrovimonas yunxiaonensis]
MRNNFILILLSTLLLSCGNDDSSNPNNTVNLVGQWKITQRTIDGNENPLGECEPFSTYTYIENGTYSELHYTADANTECLDNPSIEFNGTWQKNSETSYSFTNSNDETSEFLIEFNSNNSFTKTFSTLSNPNDPIIQTITEKFIRIE